MGGEFLIPEETIAGGSYQWQARLPSSHELTDNGYQVCKE